MFRMDTVVRLEPGVLLQNLTKANAAKVKRLRWSVQEEDWFPVTRDSRVDRRFWTLLQASFYKTYQRRGHRIFPHRVLDWVSPRTATRGSRRQRALRSLQRPAQVTPVRAEQIY